MEKSVKIFELAELLKRKGLKEGEDFDLIRVDSRNCVAFRDEEAQVWKTGLAGAEYRSYEFKSYRENFIYWLENKNAEEAHAREARERRAKESQEEINSQRHYDKTVCILTVAILRAGGNAPKTASELLTELKKSDSVNQIPYPRIKELTPQFLGTILKNCDIIQRLASVDGKIRFQAI